AAARAANLLVPGRTVAGSEVDAVELLVERDAIPDRAATAELPPLAVPGGGRHLHRFVFETVGRIARDGMEAPELLAGRCVIGGHVAAHRAVIGTAVADDH